MPKKYGFHHVKFVKLEFVALDIFGKNYLSWVLDAEIHLDAKGLGTTITEGNATSSQDKAKVMIFLRHHLDEGLKAEYLTVKDPLELWTGLKEMYDHLKATVLTRARYKWIHLQLQDFKTVCEYNSVVYKITFQLKLCGENITDEDMLEKTFTTFHASNLVLQQQYRERGFKKYYDLISCLLVVEQHNTLLFKNHEARPIGTAPLSKANVVKAHGHTEKRQNKNWGHNNMRGRGNDRKQYNNHRGSGHYKRENNMSSQSNPLRGNYHRCGMKDHWKNECWTPEHFVRLYQNSFKRKANRSGASSSNAWVESHLTFENNVDERPSQMYNDNIEANLALKNDDFNDLNDVTHLEVDDFFGDRN
ncbi:uncharacterized protein [Solanum tuberosum]|uniref:uncharacterized protein n=1 Tax=Solanum tuberosum TaxID=4113 RepID=UPI00073A4E89|nr:PREDICTED: uncharacterized protein LOC107063024 [Solanum tuberosum]